MLKYLVLRIAKVQGLFYIFHVYELIFYDCCYNKKKMLYECMYISPYSVLLEPHDTSFVCTYHCKSRETNKSPSTFSRQ